MMLCLYSRHDLTCYRQLLHQTHRAPLFGFNHNRAQVKRTCLSKIKSVLSKNLSAASASVTYSVHVCLVRSGSGPHAPRLFAEFSGDSSDQAVSHVADCFSCLFSSYDQGCLRNWLRALQAWPLRPSRLSTQLSAQTPLAPACTALAGG
jgi:hypothetical protein